MQECQSALDAKKCTSDTFALQNIRMRIRYSFMTDFEKQGGVAFLVLFFSMRNELFYLPYRDMMRWNRAKEGGRKSFRYVELDQHYY